MTRLIVGAGRQTSDHAITFDIAGEPDVRGDARHLPFRTGSIDGMDAVDVLEHISYRHAGDALREWARAMRRGGTIYVQVPEAEELMRRYIERPERLMTRRLPAGITTPFAVLEWKLLGGHDDGDYADEKTWRYNAHYSLWSPNRLRAALVVAGFETERLIVNEHPNILCWARRT